VIQLNHHIKRVSNLIEMALISLIMILQYTFRNKLVKSTEKKWL